MSEFLGGILSQNPIPPEIIAQPNEIELKKKKKKKASKDMADELDGFTYSVSTVSHVITYSVSTARSTPRFTYSVSTARFTYSVSIV